jgi:enamine deaminase RidA (YjgF/YER057c/UK114 family)
MLEQPRIIIGGHGMPEKNHILPQGMFDSSHYGYTQVVTSSPGTLIFISGQVAWDEEGNVVGDDVSTQAKQALNNLAKALDAAGATPADLTSIRVYIPNYELDHALQLGPVLSDFLEGANPPAQTLLGVQSLAMHDLLIEIEAMAVV